MWSGEGGLKGLEDIMGIWVEKGVRIGIECHLLGKWREAEGVEMEMLGHLTGGGSRSLDVKIVLWWRNSACLRDFCHGDFAKWKDVWNNGRLVGQTGLWQKLKEWGSEKLWKGGFWQHKQEYVWNLGSLRRVWQTGGVRDCWEWKWMRNAMAKNASRRNASK